MMRGGLKSLNDADSDREDDEDALPATIYCSRGLEGKTKAGSARRRGHKLDAISAVLDEQNLQWQEDIYDDVALAEVYEAYSTHCREMAHQVGLNDQDAVRRLWKDTDPTVTARRPGPVDLDDSLHDIASLCSLSLDGSEDEDDDESEDGDHHRGQCISPKSTMGSPASHEVLAKLRGIIVSRGLRAAVLRDISLQPQPCDCDSPSAEAHRQSMFSTPPPPLQPSHRSSTTSASSSSMPSLEPLSLSDSEYSDSSTSSNKDAAAAVAFMMQLQDICDDRIHRQAVLKDVQRISVFRRSRTASM